MNVAYAKKIHKYLEVYVLSVFFLSLFQAVFRMDAATYSIVVVFLVIPLIGGVCAYKIGAYPGIIKWFIPAVFGILNFIPTKFAFGTIGELDFIFAFAFSMIGLMIRVLVQRSKSKKTPLEEK